MSGGAVRSVRAAWGGLLLSRPATVLRVLGVHDDTAVGVARVLGARHVVQAAVTSRVGWAAKLGPVVDLLHAASMLALAKASPEHRRAALTSAAGATTFAVATLAADR